MAAHAVGNRRRWRRRRASGRSQARRSEAGFTLIEVMIAVLLTAIATSGIIGLYTSQTRASGFSRRSTEATVLAQDQLERLRTLAAAPGVGTDANLDALGNVGTGVYTRDWTVTLDASAAFYNMTVTVSWDDDGATKDVTLLARRNL